MKAKAAEDRKVLQTFSLPFHIREKLFQKSQRWGFGMSEYLTAILDYAFDHEDTTEKNFHPSNLKIKNRGNEG